MPRRFVQDLANGDSVDEIFLVAEKQVRTARTGTSYLHVDLRDRTGVIAARLWNVSEQQARAFDKGDFLAVRGRVQQFQGALQLIISSFDRVDPQSVDRGDFLPQTSQNIDKLRERLRFFLRSISNSHLRALAECFLIDDRFMAAFSQAPAGVRHHHAYLGGLLEHVVCLMEVVDRIAPLYPGLDRDLLIMGVFLHDVGKVRELSSVPTLVYTDEGQLIGHIVLGVEILNEKLAELPKLLDASFPEELRWRLKHMIVSHHGELELGSPVLPMTPEAIALHYIDNLDAKVHSFVRDIREDRSGGASWTAYNHAINRRLFKGGTASVDSLADDEEP
jgi:3'-5' exoribonuclease